MIAPWLRFFRLKLWTTSLCNLATGAVAAGAVEDVPDPWLALLAGVTVTGFYLVGMGGNDLADRERDRTIAPDRPLPSGAISVRASLVAVGLAGLVGLAAAALLPAPTIPWSSALLLTILLYNGGAKHHPWLGPLAMGGVRTLVVLFGAACLGDVQAGLLPALVIGGHVFWVTRYSLEEERARETVLAHRARFVLAHTCVACVAVVAVFIATPLHHLGWIVPAGALAHLVRARRHHSPGWFTFRSLRSLHLLDGALQLSYNSPLTAAVCALLFGAVRPPGGPPGPRDDSLRDQAVRDETVRDEAARDTPPPGAR